MQFSESLDRFREGLAKAASCASELAKMQKNPMWEQIAKSLMGLRLKGLDMTKAKGRTKNQIDTDIENHKKHLSETIH